MFAEGRSSLRASIEEEEQMYHNVIDNLNSYFDTNIERLENKISNLRKGNPHEEVNNIISVDEAALDIYREGLSKCLEMLIVRIHSYVESNLHAMIKQYFSWSENKIKDGKKVLSQNRKYKFSDLEAYFVILKQQRNSSLELRHEWRDFDEFHNLRNHIVHSKSAEDNISMRLTADYLKKNLDMAAHLLKKIDDQHSVNKFQHS